MRLFSYALPCSRLGRGSVSSSINPREEKLLFQSHEASAEGTIYKASARIPLSNVDLLGILLPWSLLLLL